ncbi:hypothetical protein FFWV33_06290 [Flavobacterium faecale]|uniref:Uncharacterized protein n=1 Tax=Flavobacterium faecale TaxID=1355330 RepID=A0A2S1LBQ3_9FLAO|nr:hypothetical protein [Flavobacterium faecale]AWG21171.1 hypothetical protein FFWV33_06290 [Flavobacterium faecale]
MAKTSQKHLKRKNGQLVGKCDLTSRSTFVAPLYQQLETTNNMKTIHHIIASIKTFFTANPTEVQPQLIAVDQAHFCDTVGLSDYYCDENNLFI